MVSQTALTCERYAAGCTKTKAKILRPESSEKEKNAPGTARKRRNRVRFGCWRGWERLWAGANGWESLAIGQKDLSRLPARAVRGRAPLALAHPSARGFGVDVGEHTWERGRGCAAQSFRTSPKKELLFWCCGNYFGARVFPKGREKIASACIFLFPSELKCPRSHITILKSDIAIRNFRCLSRSHWCPFPLF